MYPEKFEDLIAAFRHLPGVGIKTAERYAFYGIGLGSGDLGRDDRQPAGSPKRIGCL